MPAGEKRVQDSFEESNDHDPDHHESEEVSNSQNPLQARSGLKGKKLSLQKLRRNDSLDIEARSVNGKHVSSHGSKA